MNRIAVIGTLIASLAVGSAAIAGPNDHDRNNHRDDRRDHRDDRHDYRHDGRHDYRPGPPVRGFYHAPTYRAPLRFGYYQAPRGYYSHRWVRGERLPPGYYARSYVIDDYRDCGLRAPPRGYHWVRVDGDAVLAAVATGIVLDTVFHAFH